MTSPEFRRKIARAKRHLQRNGNPFEEEIHVKVASELRKAGVAFIHCPNEGQVKPQYGAKLKRLGVSSGVPDLMLITPPPCGGYPAAALEIKRRGGRLSATQREWLNTMASYGWATACEYGLDDCLNRLKEWGYL